MTSGSGSRRNRPPAPKITVSLAGNTITVSDGTHTRLSSCASSSAAKSLASRMTNDSAFAARWMNCTEAVQLDLPLATTRDD